MATKTSPRYPGHLFTFSLNVGISPKGDSRDNDQAKILLETVPNSEDDGVWESAVFLLMCFDPSAVEREQEKLETVREMPVKPVICTPGYAQGMRASIRCSLV
jgi:hypothetical protein